MSMSRKRPPESSLELLLDTICNTFGGILFVAILVCVLLKFTVRPNTSRSKTEDNTADRKQVAQEIAVATLRKTSLEHTITQQSELARNLAPAAVTTQFADVTRLREERDRLHREVGQSRGTIKDLQQVATEQSTAGQRLDEEIAAARRQLEQAQEKLKATMTSSGQALRLPRLHSTDKLEVGFVVRYGRLYQWHRYLSGIRIGLNTDEFVVVKEDVDSVETLPKPYAGLSLTEPSQELVVARLNNFSPRTHFISIAIWPDSFDRFQMLKEAVVRLGFEYRIVIISDGESLTDRGGRGLVQ